MKRLIALSTLSLLVLLTGCRISQSVSPVSEGVVIPRLYIEENPDVHMEGLLPELRDQFESMGYVVETYSGERPEEAVYHVEYTANWAWDMAMYLTYFQLKLYESDRLLGHAEYDARSGGANMDKFGKTADKIRPLIKELMLNARPASR